MIASGNIRLVVCDALLKVIAELRRIRTEALSVDQAFDRLRHEKLELDDAFDKSLKNEHHLEHSLDVLSAEKQALKTTLAHREHALSELIQSHSRLQADHTLLHQHHISMTFAARSLALLAHPRHRKVIRMLQVNGRLPWE